MAVTDNIYCAMQSTLLAPITCSDSFMHMQVLALVLFCPYLSPSVAHLNSTPSSMAPPKISDDDEPKTIRTAVDIALRTVSAVRDLVPLEAAKGPLSVLCTCLTLLQVVYGLKVL